MPSSLTPGSSTSHVSSVAMPTRPSPRSERLGTPNNPAIRFTRGSSFEASLVRVCYGLSGCSPPWTDRTKFPCPTGDFYIQASGGSVALPAAGYDYNSNWTPLLAGLSPAGMAASLAAPDLIERNLGLGLEGDRLGHTGLLAPGWIIRPLLRPCCTDTARRQRFQYLRRFRQFRKPQHNQWVGVSMHQRYVRTTSPCVGLGGKLPGDAGSYANEWPAIAFG